VRFICFFFKLREYPSDFGHKSLDVEFLAPKRQLACGGIEQAKAVNLIMAPEHVRSDYEIDYAMISRIFPPSVEPFVKVLEIVPHRHVSERRIIIHVNAVTQGLAYLREFTARSPEGFRDIRGCVK
jgi:hypothetical protein